MERDSRFELLRIIAITFIFCHHSLLAAGLMNYGIAVSVNPNKIIGIGLNSIFIIGVNLFFLISGYFGMHFSVSKLLKLLYIVLVCCLFEIIFIEYENKKIILKNIFFMRSTNSFVPCYIALFLMSPFINKGLATLSIINMKKFIILFTIVDVFIGCILHYDSISFIGGYGLINYMYMYVLGYYFSKSPLKDNKNLIIIYILSYICLVLWAYFYKSNFSAFAYNNPFVVLLSCSFFLIFSKFKITSSLINKIATSTFAMFLLELFIRQNLLPANKTNLGVGFFINSFVDYVALFVLAYLITSFCNKTFIYIKPYLKKIDNYFKF